MQKKPNLYVSTVAYNAEKTIRRTIESVLNQTYQDFTYLLRDNGSVDQTFRICQEYASKDDRIVLLHNAQNGVYQTEEEQAHIKIERGVRYGFSLQEEDYWCILDADDVYMPYFLDQGMAMAEAQNLDIVIGGTEVIPPNGTKANTAHCYETPWVIEGQAFSALFPRYHWHMRQLWGKLYRKHVLLGMREYISALLEEKLKENAAMGLPYGADTICATYSFGRAHRIGVLAGCQHRYYIQEKSVSNTFQTNRVASDQILDQVSYDFLIQKCGAVHPQNRGFLSEVYLNAIQDTTYVALQSDLSPLEKMNVLQNIFAYEKTKELKNQANITHGMYQSYLEVVTKWVLSQRVSRTRKGAILAASILSAMYEDLFGRIEREDLQYIILKIPEIIPLLLQEKYELVWERLQTWYRRHEKDDPAFANLELFVHQIQDTEKAEVFLCLVQIKKERPKSAEVLTVDKKICDMIKEIPLLMDLSPQLACAFSSVIYFILKDDTRKAFDAFVTDTQQLDIAEEDVAPYLKFGQNLSAVVGNEDIYILYTKMWISYLLDCSRIGEATALLDEFVQMLPNDEDFQALRSSVPVLE